MSEMQGNDDMTHDPLCITVGLTEQERRDYLAYCVCDLIAKVRADERASIVDWLNGRGTMVEELTG